MTKEALPLNGPHPFGTDITAAELARRFADCRQWEDRLRQVITLARALPPLPDSLKTPATILAGCESRVWLGHQPLPDGTLHFYADSDGRIVKGLLAIVLTAVEGKNALELRQTDPLALFRQLGLEAELGASRADGLAAIGNRIAHIAAGG